MSSVHLPNRSILEASKVSGCDGGLHSRPELSALVSRVGGELAQVMRRRRARTCSMRSVGCRLVPSDGARGTRNSRALAFHAGGPREWHGHVSGPCHSGGPPLQLRRARAVRVLPTNVGCGSNLKDETWRKPPSIDCFPYDVRSGHGRCPMIQVPSGMCRAACTWPEGHGTRARRPHKSSFRLNDQGYSAAGHRGGPGGGLRE